MEQGAIDILGAFGLIVPAVLAFVAAEWLSGMRPSTVEVTAATFGAWLIGFSLLAVVMVLVRLDHCVPCRTVSDPVGRLVYLAVQNLPGR